MTIDYELPPLAPQEEPEPDEPVLSRAETADCTCPEFCERDHDNE